MRDEVTSRLKKFLISPDQARFSDIFDSAFIFTRGYLIYLRQKGYRLPVEMYSQESAIDDLAMDVLGGLFQNKPGMPFHIIFEFYRSNQAEDFESWDSDKLWFLFEKLLKGFAHQELTRLNKQANPQAEVLKRRFKDILKESSYVDTVHGYVEFVHLSDHKPDFTLPIIPYEELRSLAEQAFALSTNRAVWCRTIFDMLGENPTNCRAIPRCELLRAVVSVNAAFLEIPEFGPKGPPGPRESTLRQAALDVLKQTMTYVDEEIIQPFVAKKRISAEDVPRYLAACSRYLDDFGLDGDSDAIPAYFREVMPAAYSDRYLKDFKYVFETVLHGAKEDFTIRLKKNPIIRQFSDY